VTVPRLSARFLEWWREELLVDPADAAAPGEDGLALLLAAAVHASRDRPPDLTMHYEPLPHARYRDVRFSAGRWEATRRDGERMTGPRHTFGDRGVSFMLEPAPILEQSEVVRSETLPDGRRALVLREPESEAPPGPWLSLADDVVVGHACEYRAILSPAEDVVLRWDALDAEGRILRRLELTDVSFG
jgi:hypothetical protein